MSIPRLIIPEEYIIYQSDQTFYTEIFKAKLPMGYFLRDYSGTEILVELEDKNDNRIWFDLEMLFGKVIANAEILYKKNKKELLEEILISGIVEQKIKRTKYLYLVFKDKYPF